MDPRVIVSLFVLVCVCSVHAQVGSLCRPKERFLACGCPKTCKDPAPNCKGVCRVGCYCEEGEVRDENGICVKLADCPPIKSAYTQDTTEPRANNGKCPLNEEYRFCEPCAKSCDNPNPICPAQCMRGCFCIDGLLRNKEGHCVKPHQCQNSTTEQPIVYQMTCSSHQVYKQCETCERTCSDPNPRCPTPCVTGCFCELGYVKAPDGRCVQLKDCPKAEMTVGDPRLFPPAETPNGDPRLFPMPEMTIYDHDSPTIEDCAPDEEYFSCGWCEPSCSFPLPTCPNKICTTGCLCRPPLLRHHSGHCVEPKDCFPQKCKDPNEEYVCHYGCEPRCQPRRYCSVHARRCVLGCHCKPGMYRDQDTGLCVKKEQCTNTNISDTYLSQSMFRAFNLTEPVLRYIQLNPRIKKSY